MASNPDAPITPETKVGDLLKRYPELEETLVELSPTYQALKNPVLRRTVGKVATLRQVASVGGVPLGTLINRLRAAAGQEAGFEASETAEAAGERPDWAVPEKAARRYDARALIEEGGHPMEQVMHDLGETAPGEVYELVTPFAPAPLVDLAARKGFAAYSVWEGADLVRTYFRRAPEGGSE